MTPKSASPKLPGARTLALDILAGARRRAMSVEELLYDSLRSYPGLPRPERGLLLELVQGVTRWQWRLDYLLSRVSDLPLRKLHPLVLHLLRLGAYQLLFLERIPARAALHEAGQEARRRRLPQAHGGFINAVLRRLAAGEIPPLPPRAADPVLALSVEYSHPQWLVKRWLNRLGLEEIEARLAANNRIPPLTIRVNTLKTDPGALQTRLRQEGVEATPCRFSPTGLELVEVNTAPLELPSYREGLWLFQDEAAQLTSLLLGTAPGMRLLEVGAGRGGKTTHLAERLGSRGLILAVDNHSRRLQELKHNLARWGVNLVQPLRAEAAAALPLKSGFLEAAVLDVPCSALGIIRRHPEIKNRLQEEELAAFAPRQLAMLHQAAPLVKGGGRLLYITCTTEPQENEEVIAAFLAAHPDFRLATDPLLLPAAARPLVHPPGYFRTSPEEHGLDGFFAAVLESQR